MPKDQMLTSTKVMRFITVGIFTILIAISVASFLLEDDSSSNSGYSSQTTQEKPF